MTYEPLHHKYRPQTFADLVGQDAIATTLSHAVHTKRIAPAYLFTGPRGTGKTSSARILAKSLNCLQSDSPTDQPCGVCEVCKAIARGSALDVIEIDAASNTGVDNIRELIERVQFAPVQCRYKIYVLDEVHMLSTAAFNALLKTLEEPPDRVVFVLATTDPQRVLPTIISRCQRFDFRRIPLEAMVAHLRAIATQENINIAKDAVRLLAQIAQGGLRDAESLLDQLSLLPDQITVERVWDLVRMVPEQDLMALLAGIVHSDPEAVLDRARHLIDQGHEPLSVLQNLAGFYRDLLIAKTAPSRPDLVTLTSPTWAKLCDFAQNVDVSVILAGQQHLRSCEVQVKSTTQPQLWLEVAVLGLLPTSDSRPVTLAHTPVSSQPSETHRTQCSTLQLEHSTSTPTTPPAVKQPSELEASSTSTSGNGASQDQGAQPAQTEASIPWQEHSSRRETLPAHVPLPPEASEPSGQLPGQSSVGDMLQDPEPPVSAAETLQEGASAPEVLAAASPADAIQQPHLDQIWQKVVAQLHPPGTQALLHQQACLLAFDGQVARVGIRSQPLFKMAQARLPNVEAAFQKAFNHPVKVSLEVAAAIESKPASAPEQPTPKSVLFEPTPQPGKTSVQNGLTQFITPSSTQPLPPETSSPPIRSSQELPQTRGEASPQGLNSSVTHSQTAQSDATRKQDDPVTQAAKSLAHFFNGEIVTQENELVSGSTPPSGNLNSPEPLVNSAEEDFPEPDEEDEIPF